MVAESVMLGNRACWLTIYRRGEKSVLEPPTNLIYAEAPLESVVIRLYNDLQATRPKKNPDVAEKIGSTTMLFDANAGRLYELNESAKTMWVLCDGKRTVADVARAMAAEYDAPAEKLAADAAAFVKKMMELGLLVG
jgi:hypothetical protein